MRGDRYEEGWSTYRILIRGFDELGGVSNEDYVLEITTVVDCLTNAQLTPSLPIPKTLDYKVGSPNVITAFPPMVDHIAQTLKIPDICGPISYNFTASNDNGDVLYQTSLPSFVKYNPEKRELDIFTVENSFAGSWYFLLDIFYSFFDSSNPSQNFHYK